MSMRLDKFLSEMQAATRSEARQLVKKGLVTVNGALPKGPEQKVSPETDCIRVKDREIRYEPFEYVMFYKPAGCVTAVKDNVHKTVMDYLKETRRTDLFPVGRLDLDTEGLLLITNDGALSHALLSPSHHVEKTYLVRTDLPITESDLRLLENGVDIGDEKPAAPAKTELVKEDQLLLTITEGRFHQVKRMLGACGKQVLFLKRLSMGSLVLDEALRPGEYRPLTGEELDRLRQWKDAR